MAQNKDLKKLIKAVESQGCVVTVSTKGHWLFNKDGRRVAVTGSTPSDPRSFANLKADLRRAGYTV
ncbi:HicA-like toxin [Microbacterium phage FlameThrower]|nr:HicA-like toxin [Microbacterium phage FlameThrower]